MRQSLIKLAGLAVLLSATVAEAQTTAPSATAPTPPTTTPNAITPPNGVARGVISPNRPVDTGAVIRPPAHSNTMPVIKPSGTAR